MSFFKEKNEEEFGLRVTVISPKEHRLNLIVEQLRLKGLNNFNKINKDFFDVEYNDNSQAVVIDLENIDDEEVYISAILKSLPKDMVYVVLGNNDSIKIYQKFVSYGIYYLNWETQISEIYEKIISFDKEEFISHPIKISFMSCKGGIGSSYLSYNFAKILKQRYKTNILNVQGFNSSFNLDFISGRTFEQKDLSNKELSLYKELKENAYDFHNKEFKSFNFIVYDHSIQALNKDELEHILNESDTVVLLINNDLASLRKAKEVLKINEFLNSVNQGVKNLSVCLNENTKKVSSLNLNDLESIIEKRINMSIPFIKFDTSKSPYSLPKKIESSLNTLIDKIVGEKKKKKFSFFSK